MVSSQCCLMLAEGACYPKDMWWGFKIFFALMRYSIYTSFETGVHIIRRTNRGMPVPPAKCWAKTLNVLASTYDPLCQLLCGQNMTLYDHRHPAPKEDQEAPLVQHHNSPQPQISVYIYTLYINVDVIFIHTCIYMTNFPPCFVQPTPVSLYHPPNPSMAFFPRSLAFCVHRLFSPPRDSIKVSARSWGKVASWDPTNMGTVSKLLIPFPPLSSNHMREEVL